MRRSGLEPRIPLGPCACGCGELVPTQWALYRQGHSRHLRHPVETFQPEPWLSEWIAEHGDVGEEVLRLAAEQDQDSRSGRRIGFGQLSLDDLREQGIEVAIENEGWEIAAARNRTSPQRQ